MREFKTQGKQILINGQPTFLRGTLECAIFPKTGYPAHDVQPNGCAFSMCRAHGLNHMRFHSWCPPKAAFDAADQTGFYLQVECSSWANQSTTLGDGKPFDNYLYEESQRMMEEYGNHPSFVCWPMATNRVAQISINFSPILSTFGKKKIQRRVFTLGSWLAQSSGK
jgi:beta-galactosidase/beta-glucuronidase